MPSAYGCARLVNLIDGAQQKLGDRFDEKAFLAQYLSYGPSSFNLLADRLDKWVAEQ